LLAAFILWNVKILLYPAAPLASDARPVDGPARTAFAPGEFLCVSPDGKRSLVKIVTSNRQLVGKRLEIALSKPFDEIAKRHDVSNGGTLGLRIAVRG
jgi:hypothetical protein